MSDLVRVLVKEGKRRVLFLTSILVIVSLSALVLGMVLPKRYDAITVLMIEAGQAGKLVQSREEKIDLTPVTLQITEGKRVMRELLVFGGWVQPPPAKQPDPAEEDRMISKLRAHIKIDTSKDGFVKIGYWDNDADRTYKLVNRLAEIYIRESEESQTRESKEAFEFLEKQAKEYGDKLAADHAQVLARVQGLGSPVPPTPSTSGSTSASATPPPPPRPTGALSADEIAALRTEKLTLESQLAKKSGGAPVDLAAENAARQKVASLQSELDRLRAAYTEEHPDVKRVKRELTAAKEDLASIETTRKARERDDRNAEALDEEVRAAARTRLEAINRRLAMAGVQVPPSPALTKNPLGSPSAQAADPELKGIGADTTLAELVRRYEATREVYQDILKRRESARVAMELVQQHRGFSLHIQEPAERPTAATGLRLSHFCLVGLLLGLFLPLGVLFGIVKLNNNVTTAYQIDVMARVPLLVSISPGVPGSNNTATVINSADREQRRMRAAIGMVAVVFLIYIGVFIVKTRG